MKILIVKAVVQIVLLILALYFFGVPSWQRFQDKKVVVVTSQDDQHGLPAPAVTVCGRNPKTDNYFPISKPLSMYMNNSSLNRVDICQGKEGEDIVKCVENETFNLNQILSTKGNDNKWLADFGAFGMCFTLKISLDMTPNSMSMINLLFRNHTSFALFVHDPKLFVQNLNSQMPFKYKSYEGFQNVELQELVIIQHQNLNLPMKPCNPDPSYSLTACIKQSVSNEIGCSLHWDLWTSGLNTCQKLEEYR